MQDMKNDDQQKYIDDCQSRIDSTKQKWEGKADESEDALKEEFNKRVNDLQNKLDELKETSKDKWKDAKQKVEEVWEDFKDWLEDTF